MGQRELLWTETRERSEATARHSPAVDICKAKRRQSLTIGTRWRCQARAGLGSRRTVGDDMQTKRMKPTQKQQITAGSAYARSEVKRTQR